MNDQKPIKPPVLPWGVFWRQPRRCTVCGSKEIVRDGRYWCRAHHPDYQS